MKAVTWSRYGKPADVLAVKEVDKPMPKKNEILVKVHASASTIADAKLRAFNFPKGFRLIGKLIFGILKPRKSIMRSNFAGVMESVGVSVKTFQIGDRVCGSTGINMGGANAEYLCIREKDTIVHIPNNTTYQDAAAIIFGGLTAHYFFVERANLQPHQHVLINGASGAVGTAAIQLTRFLGADVTGVCSGKNSALVKSIGANSVIDYTVEDFTQNGKQYDLILDAVGNLTYDSCKHSLTKEGKLILINTDLPTILYSLFNKHLICGAATERKEDLAYLLELVNSGEIKPVIDIINPLEDIVKVHKYIDEGHKRGNIVIEIIKEAS